MKEDLTVLIMGSSRPQLWPLMWKSFKEMCFTRRNLQVIVHEDSVIPEETRKVIQYVDSLDEVDKFRISDPKIGLGPAMTKMFELVDTKYMLYLQEDWQFERPIDLDEILFVMDHPKTNVNLVFFNKYKNFPTLNGLSQEEVCHTGMWTCLFHGWTFLPGIWNMDFVNRHWRTRDIRPEGYFTQVFEGRDDNEWCKKNLGAYIYGKHHDWRYVRHMGDSWRMADWRLENGQPGGMIEPDQYSRAFRAPWLQYSSIPENKNMQFDKERFEKALSEEPIEIQNVIRGVNK